MGCDCCPMFYFSGRLPHPKLKQAKLPEKPYKVDKVFALNHKSVQVE